MKQAIKLIEEHCRKHRADYHQGLNEFLDFLVEFFDISYMSDADGFVRRTIQMKEKSEELFTLSIIWMNKVARALEQGKWVDFFGDLYEEMYLSRGKASALGQFFTPCDVADLLCDVVKQGDARTVNDPACGSGRMLLAHFAKSDKKGYYVGEDLDVMAVKMCALNLMMHGAQGKVVQHNTLTNPTTYDYGFELNEVRYPISTPFYSLRRIKRTEEIKKEKEQEKKEPVQLSLF